MDKFINQLTEKIVLLSKQKQILFVALCCEKLESNYKRFYDVTNWGNPEIIREIIEFLYLSVYRSQNGNQEKAKELLNILEKVTPDTDDFTSIYTSYAFDAGCALYEALHFLIDSKVEHVINAASFARNTVDMFVQDYSTLDPNEDDFEIKINNDPFMISEYNRQNELLTSILDARTISDDVIKKMRALNDNFYVVDLDRLSMA